MIDPGTQLSPEGARRRERILRLAQDEAGRRRRRRVASRTALALVAAALAVPLVLRSRSIHHDVPTARGPVHLPTPHVPSPPIAAAQSVRIVRIETDRRIVDRLRIEPDTLGIRRINDNELLQRLAEAHRPAALLYVGGRETIQFRK